VTGSRCREQERSENVTGVTGSPQLVTPVTGRLQHPTDDRPAVDRRST
jgi:hypothetical protein